MSAMDVDQPSSTPSPVKRVAVTYGRRRERQPEVRDSSVTLADCSSPAVELELLDGKESDSANVLAPDAQQSSQSSSTTYANDDGIDDTSPTKLKHQFSWRAQLKALDEAFDNDEDSLVQSRVNERSSSSPLQKPIQPLPFENQSARMDATPPPPVPQIYDGLLGDTLLPHRSKLPAHTSLAEGCLEDSPIVSRKVRRPRKRVDSDSEREISEQSSPIHHPINTPLLRSPPTPSTSEFEMPSTRHKVDKGKGKAPTRNVPPLRFESESASAISASKKGHKARRKDDSVRPKTKAPTKKELRETVLESSRIIASKSVEVARTEQLKHTKTWLFDRIKDGALLSQQKQPEPPSDPISNFSSSPVPPVEDGANKVEQGASSFGAPSRLLVSSVIAHPRVRAPYRNVTRHASPQRRPAASDSTDDEMPSVTDLLRQEEAKRTEADHKRDLAEFKQRALQDAARRSSMAEDSDDDLEIVNDMHVTAQEEAAKRKSEKLLHITPSKGKARQLALARKSLPGSSGSRTNPFAQANLTEYLRKSAMSSFDRKVRRKESAAPLTTQQLSKALMRRAETEKLKFIKEREKEWKQRGGRALEEPVDAGENTSFRDRLEAYAQRGLEAAECDGTTFGGVEAYDTDEDEDEDEDDEDYAPEERGSASPEPTNTDDEGGSDQENQHSGLDVNDDVEQQTEAEDEELQVRKRGIRRSRMVASDDEDDIPRILVPNSSVLDLESVSNPVVIRNSESDQTEDENDKENSQMLMYDRSEDKENKAVVRHSTSVARPPLGSRPAPPLDIQDGVHGRSSSPSLGGFDAVSNSPKQDLRSPLKEIAEDDDLFLSSQSPFTARLLQSTSKHPASPPRASASQMSLDSPPALRSVQLGRLGSSFSDFENDNNMVKGFGSGALLPSFSETLSQSSPASCVLLNPLANGGLSKLFSDENDEGLSFKKPTLLEDDLSLSLDVGLGPALEVSSTLRRKADNIFEKEQEYLIENANLQQKPNRSPELYISENGFLTQTRPMGPDAEQYRVTSTSFQSPQFLASQLLLGDVIPSSIERAPLRTLSFTAMPESPDAQPLRRLRRRSTSPLDGKVPLQDDGSLLPPLLISQVPKRNVFDVLGRQPTSDAPRRKQEKSEFIAAEAVESDDDELIGFGPIKKDEDEEMDDEDDDKVVEGLVDDAVMDAEIERPDLVQEKFREHEEEDDKQVEKLHQDAIQGKLRTKRRDRGIGFDEDSDNDEEDEHNRRIRRGMFKKRKIDGDTLEDLGRNEETKAFYEAYQRDLIDDDVEFVHLQVDTQMSGEDEDEETRKVVSIEALNDEIREAVRNKEAFGTLDPEDISWIDRGEDEDGDTVPFKVMTDGPSKIHAKRPALSQSDFGPERPNRTMENDQEKVKLRSWARGQGSGNQGTGRSAVGAAITGHAKTKVKTGGGSLRVGQAAATSKSTVTASVSRKVEKGRSMLSLVSDRSTRFV